MLFSKKYKWLLSIAFIASIISYSGYSRNGITNSYNSIELLVLKKPVSKSALYYFGVANSNLQNSFEFNFYTLLINYNSINNLLYSTNKDNALQYVHFNKFKLVKQPSSKGDYEIIFIG